MRTITICALIAAVSLSAFAADRDSVVASLPPIEDERFVSLLNSPALWYDDSTMPRAYQHAGAVHWVHYNISAAKPFERFGNGNLEFPWGVGGGLHLSPNHQTAKFLVLPDRPGGGKWPVVITRRRPVSWTFPAGTVLCEVLSLRYDGANYPFETRALQRDLDAWDPVHLLRQFWTVDDVASGIEHIAPDQRQLAERVRRSPRNSYRVRDTTHPRSAFSRTFVGRDLPPLPRDIVLRLLDFPLRPGLETYELMSKTDSVVPANYLGAILGEDRESCAACHTHVGKHVDDFGPLGRDWYGHIRGADGIFSFHPFARQSISTNGFNLPVRFNQRLLEAGWIEQYDPRKHPKSVYRRISR